MILKKISEVYNDEKFFSFIREKFQSEDEFREYILQSDMNVYTKNDEDYISTIELTKKVTGKSNIIGNIIRNFETIIYLLFIFIMPNIISIIILMAIVVVNKNIIRNTISTIYKHIKSKTL